MSTDDLLARMLGRTIAQLDVMEAERDALIVERDAREDQFLAALNLEHDATRGYRERAERAEAEREELRAATQRVRDAADEYIYTRWPDGGSPMEADVAADHVAHEILKALDWVTL